MGVYEAVAAFHKTIGYGAGGRTIFLNIYFNKYIK